jgi:hypothetical protein
LKNLVNEGGYRGNGETLHHRDPDMHHYAVASGPAVVQVHGMSPLQFNYVNPADDFSKKK